MLEKKKLAKTSEKELHEIKIDNMPDKQFKVIIVNVLTGQEKEKNLDFQKRDKKQNKTKKQAQLKNTIIEMKHTLEGINSTLTDTEE